MSRKLWALESLDLEETVVENEAPEASVEAALVEVEGLDADIDALEADGETLAEDTATVEGTAEVIADSLGAEVSDAGEITEEGEGEGLDENGARLAAVALEQICNRWGIERKQTGIGLEAFGNRATRRSATRVALEAAEDAKQGLWARFVAWLKSMYEKAKDLYVKYFNAGKGFVKRGEALKKAAGNMGELKKDVTDLTAGFMGDWVKAIVIDGQLSVRAFIEQAEKITGVGKSIPVHVSAIYDDASKGVKRAADSGPDFGVKTTKNLNKLVGEDVKIEGVRALPHNSYFIVTADKDMVSSAHYFDAVSDVDTKAGIKISDVTKTPAELAELIIKIGGALENRIKDYRTANEKMKALTDILVAAKKKEAKTEEEKKAKASDTAHARASVNKAKAWEKADMRATKHYCSGLVGLCTAYIKAHEAKK